MDTVNNPFDLANLDKRLKAAIDMEETLQKNTEAQEDFLQSLRKQHELELHELRLANIKAEQAFKLDSDEDILMELATREEKWTQKFNAAKAEAYEKEVQKLEKKKRGKKLTKDELANIRKKVDAEFKTRDEYRKKELKKEAAEERKRASDALQGKLAKGQVLD